MESGHWEGKPGAPNQCAILHTSKSVLPSFSVQSPALEFQSSPFGRKDEKEEVDLTFSYSRCTCQWTVANGCRGCSAALGAFYLNSDFEVLYGTQVPTHVFSLLLFLKHFGNRDLFLFLFVSLIVFSIMPCM